VTGRDDMVVITRPLSLLRVMAGAQSLGSRAGARGLLQATRLSWADRWDCSGWPTAAMS